MKIIRDIKETSWPVREAKRLIARLDGLQKPTAVFATGYGPSGLPHIGTFGEVVRTAILRHAFTYLSGAKSELLTFSDDLDGMRRIPSNLPNQEMLAEHLGEPLSVVPDPFEKFPSFAAHNNNALVCFLDQYNFHYQFISASDMYKQGLMDKVLLKVLEKYDEVVAAVLPSIGKDRQQSYCPFLPISPVTGKVLQVPLVAKNVAKGTITYREDGKEYEVPVTGGRCKLQWKVDWAARWVAFGVDYEMHGKDLIDSAIISNKVCKVLGGKPPLKLIYELFLDEEGQKISKSKGNGITMEDWLKYGPKESLALFMYQSPTKAKKLGWKSVGKATDEYISHLNSYQTEDQEKRLSNPVWYLFDGNPPTGIIPISFAMLLNLAGVCKEPTTEGLWRIIKHQLGKKIEPHQETFVHNLISYAIAYFQKFLSPLRNRRQPTSQEKAALQDLLAYLKECDDHVTGEAIQSKLYALGREYEFSSLRAWFQALYEIFIGQQDGPRFGNFIVVYGLQKTIKMIEDVVAQK